MKPLLEVYERRIRVNISDQARVTLESDLLDFDGQKPSHSGMINKILLAYHSSARHDKATREHVLSLKPSVYVKEVPRMQNAAAGLLHSQQELIAAEYDGSPGRYIKSVIEQYALLPYLERERVYFQETVFALESAIRHQEKLKIQTRHGVIKVRPYLMGSDRLSTFNYLAGYYSELGTGEERIGVFRISRIALIHSRAEEGELTQFERDTIERAIKTRGLPFIASDETRAVVRLTESGVRMYSTLLQNRPMYVSRDGNEYLFLCTLAQLEFYFLKFGAEADVLEPPELRQRFREFYRRALGKYEDADH
jgi:hypothetical protein